jgi:hypothetical protein
MSTRQTPPFLNDNARLAPVGVGRTFPGDVPTQRLHLPRPPRPLPVRPGPRYMRATLAMPRWRDAGPNECPGTMLCVATF